MQNGVMENVGSLAQRIRHIYDKLQEKQVSINGLDSNITDLTGRIARVEKSVGSEGLGVTARLDALDGGGINTPNDVPEKNVK
jgi:peptidoglycan hydrolase CwlO-like protein